MKLVSPQPNQIFFHVPPVGNTYASDASCLIVPLTADDAASLRALGCVDVEPAPADVEPAQTAPVFDDGEDEPRP